MEIISNWDDVFLNLPKSLQEKILEGIKEDEVQEPSRLEREIKFKIQKLDYKFIKKEIKLEIILFLIYNWEIFRNWWLNVIKEIKEKFDAYNWCAWYIDRHENIIPHAMLYYIDDWIDYIISFWAWFTRNNIDEIAKDCDWKFYDNRKEIRNKLFNQVKEKKFYRDKKENWIYIDKEFIDVKKIKTGKGYPKAIYNLFTKNCSHKAELWLIEWWFLPWPPSWKWLLPQWLEFKVYSQIKNKTKIIWEPKEK